MFEVELPGGVAVFRVGQPPIGPTEELLGQSLAVISAYNPGTARPGETRNAAANKHLGVQLRKENWEFYPAVGISVDRAHQEPSFAIVGMRREEASELGAQHGQACVYYWNGATGDLVWC